MDGYRQITGSHISVTVLKLTYDVFIDDADRQWLSDFFFVHIIRGVKDDNRHPLNEESAAIAVDRFANKVHLTHDFHLDGDWYIDIGIELSSPLGQCLQWSTASHSSVVEDILQIPPHHASRITSHSSSKYSRDLVSHLSDVSGFRIEPGPQAAGPFQAIYIQAYTTDKSLTSNNEGQHHAKFIEATEALQQIQPSVIISSLHDIYTQAKEKNASKARLEVRVPWMLGKTVLTTLSYDIFMNGLYSFTREEWWELRIMRLFAISNLLGLQSLGPTHKRFSPGSLLLTAACVWLMNSLHARPDDGPSSRDLMDAALPVRVAADVLDSQLAYPTSIGETNMHKIAYIPFGCVFFRRMVCGEVPRLRMGGPLLPSKSFHYFFKADIDELRRTYQTSGFLDDSVVRQNRFTTSKGKLPIYHRFGSPEPELFAFATEGDELYQPVIDDGSDVEECPHTPVNRADSDDEPQGIDAQLSQLWRQFVSDLTAKSPNPRGGGIRPSYMKLTPEQRYSGSEDPYKSLRLYEIFTDVWYKNASEEEWDVCFNNLFPPIGFVSTTRRQGYKPSPYYQDWMVMLEQNRDNADLVKRIRDGFRERMFTWEWMPKAESDKMWTTSAKKDGKRAFMCWPVKEDREAAPFILLEKNAVPIFAPPEDEDMGVNDS
ncbi:hypothetical protein NP233_g8773 [Leucocoprinus birnbaumii]|uniref:Uncharacterized protein n=1 Tax=Leucocoprinus birnbaumii TaxID=56174 RepID=A0AAD5YRI8_9AGAR|nr:hypothetical protein NP233_g8773 [Leucocoprinus birnbaumii]